MEPGGRPLPVRPASGAAWILVCDDTASIRLLMRINLELAGFEVVEVADGQAALDLLDRNPDRLPAVVLLDAQMAPLDGWGAVAAIRSNPDLAHLPIIMVTASLQQHIEHGLDLHLERQPTIRDLIKPGLRVHQDPGTLTAYRPADHRGFGSHDSFPSYRLRLSAVQPAGSRLFG
jgi:CheY-like chemotaxis protein